MTAPTIDAPDVVTRAVAGDSGAFAGLYEQYHGLVFRFIFRRVGNPTLAEDLAADVFVRVLKRINTFTWQGTDIGAWLLAITRNIIADYYRSGRYRYEIASGDGPDDTRASSDLEARPEETVTDHLTNVAVLRLLNELAPDQHDVMVLRFLRGLSLAETADAMGKNESAVKALQYRAVRSLARHLPEGWTR